MYLERYSVITLTLELFLLFFFFELLCIMLNVFKDFYDNIIRLGNSNNVYVKKLLFSYRSSQACIYMMFRLAGGCYCVENDTFF